MRGQKGFSLQGGSLISHYIDLLNVDADYYSRGFWKMHEIKATERELEKILFTDIVCLTVKSDKEI